MNLLVFKSHCPILSTKSPVDRVPVREFYWATELVTRYYGTSLYEAADVDGASFWDRLFRVTLPLLMPSLTVSTVLNIIYMFNSFPIVCGPSPKATRRTRPTPL